MTDKILNHVIVEGTTLQIERLLAAHFRKLSAAEELHRPFTNHEFHWHSIVPLPVSVSELGDVAKVLNWQLENWEYAFLPQNETESSFGQNGSYNFRFPTIGAEPKPVLEALVKKFPGLKFNFASISMPNFCVFMGVGNNGRLTCVDDEYR
ncbi:hypothetical protein AB1P65_06265 [Roseibium alexandrii]